MNKQRTGAAIDWLMRLSEDNVGEQELSAWIAWCADPDNLREFQEVRRTWRGFERLGPAASELLETVLEPAGAPAAAEHARFLRTPWFRAMAATFVLAAAAVVVWRFDLIGTRDRTEIAARTQVESTVLPDGSALALAPRTRLAVDFTGPDRTLRFASGEAWFKVKPDPARPFVVHTAGLKVTAIGTAFDVRSEPERVAVSVQEGAVEVADLPGSGTWRLAAGHRLIYDTRLRTAQVDAIDIGRTVAWQEGRLEYFAAPLSTVVEDINRYSGRTVEIGEARLGQLQFTGSVFTRAIDDWLSGIEATFPVRVLVARDGHTVLLPRHD